MGIRYLCCVANGQKMEMPKILQVEAGIFLRLWFLLSTWYLILNYVWEKCPCFIKYLEIIYCPVLLFHCMSLYCRSYSIGRHFRTCLGMLYDIEIEVEIPASVLYRIYTLSAQSFLSSGKSVMANILLAIMYLTANYLFEQIISGTTEDFRCTSCDPHISRS